jgi:hypothetical protein
MDFTFLFIKTAVLQTLRARNLNVTAKFAAFNPLSRNRLIPNFLARSEWSERDRSEWSEKACLGVSEA